MHDWHGWIHHLRRCRVFRTASLLFSCGPVMMIPVSSLASSLLFLSHTHTLSHLSPSSTSSHLSPHSLTYTLSFLSVLLFLLYKIAQTVSKWWYSPNDDAWLIPPLGFGLSSDSLLAYTPHELPETIEKRKKKRNIKIIKIKINMTAESPAFSDVFIHCYIFTWRATHSSLSSSLSPPLSLALLSD